jgi:hypothetical protein
MDQIYHGIVLLSARHHVAPSTPGGQISAQIAERRKKMNAAGERGRRSSML